MFCWPLCQRPQLFEKHNCQSLPAVLWARYYTNILLGMSSQVLSSWQKTWNPMQSVANSIPTLPPVVFAGGCSPQLYSNQLWKEWQPKPQNCVPVLHVAGFKLARNGCQVMSNDVALWLRPCGVAWDAVPKQASLLKLRRTPALFELKVFPQTAYSRDNCCYALTMQGTVPTCPCRPVCLWSTEFFFVLPLFVFLWRNE